MSIFVISVTQLSIFVSLPFSFSVHQFISLYIFRCDYCSSKIHQVH